MGQTQTVIAEGYASPEMVRPHLHVVPDEAIPEATNPTGSELPPEQPIIVVAERAEDEWSRQRAERIFARVGATILEEVVTVETVPEEQPVTLQEAIHRAAQGDQEAKQMVRSNAHAEGSEILYKAAYVTEVTLEQDEQGRTIQFGQTGEDFSLNTLRYASDHDRIMPRSRAETRNTMRIEDLNREGLLEDNYFVVVSLCERDMSDEELDDLNLFSDTYSMTIQATTKSGEKKLKLESAFIAGIAQKDDDHERHDLQAVEHFGKKLNVDLSGLDGASLIDFSLLIPKDKMPDGVINLAELMDECIEEVIDEPVFYGQAKPKQDYKEHREACRQKEETLEARTNRAADALIAEDAKIKNPVQATQRLNKLVEAEMLQIATEDHTINANVFGREGAKELKTARECQINGDTRGWQAAMFRAAKVAKSGSCPAALRKLLEGNNFEYDDVDSDARQDDGEASEEDCVEIKNGDVVECPFCHEEVEAVVRGEDIYCTNKDCKAVDPKRKK